MTRAQLVVTSCEVWARAPVDGILAAEDGGPPLGFVCLGASLREEEDPQLVRTSLLAVLAAAASRLPRVVELDVHAAHLVAGGVLAAAHVVTKDDGSTRRYAVEVYRRLPGSLPDWERVLSMTQCPHDPC